VRFGERVSAHGRQVLGGRMINTKIGTVLIAIAVAAIVALPAGVLAGKPAKTVDWTSRIAAELDMAYAEQIVDDICSMGDGELGFRGAGGDADIAAANYILEQMEDIGLSEPVLEAVPVSEWEFHEAWLEIPGLPRMTAASFGGFVGTDSPTTPKAEVRAGDLVWVNNGYESDYEGKDVAGKLVLVNWIGYDFWVDSIAFAAWQHGAAGIVVTTLDSNVGQGPDAISCHDGLYAPGWPPLISISKEDAMKVLDAMGSDEMISDTTMYSDIEEMPPNWEDPEAGGHGYNVVGYLPGKNWLKSGEEYVIIGPHHDAWFQGAMDDTSGVAALLVIADAMVKIREEYGWVPERTIIFTSHTGEEYGINNTYYDWCWGAYYQINIEHKDDWVGKSAAYLCLELMGMAGEPVGVNCVPETYSFVRQVLAKNTKNMPYGWSVTPKAHTWADHWTFSAAGVPGIEFETVSDEWETQYYHSQLDAPVLIDYTYMEMLFRVLTDMTVRLASDVIIPYNFSTLSKNLNEELLMSDEFGVGGLYEIYAQYGLDPATNLQRAVDAAAEFEEKAAALNYALKDASPEDPSVINSWLMDIAGTLDTSLIAIGVWEQDWFPYQQPLNDVYHTVEALKILESGYLGDAVSDAMWELNWVGIIWYYDYMSYENYMDQRDRLSGDRVASWGLQTHLQPAAEIWEEYDGLASLAYDDVVTWEDVEWIVDGLEDKLQAIMLTQLEDAFQLMWMALSEANDQIDQLIEML